MRNLFRALTISIVATAGAALPGCGGGGSEVHAGAGVITITAFAPLAIPGGTPTPFAITGTNFETVTGTTAQVIFHALGGATPFLGGGSDTATVIGLVTSDTTITGTTPAATICGVASISIEVTVILESGVKSNTFTTLGLVITAPTVTGTTPGTIPAINVPPTISVDGTGFGPVGGAATVRFISTPGNDFFGDGTLPEVAVVGTIASATSITVAPPKATICGPTFVTVSIQVTFDATGSCSAVAPAALRYDTPAVTAFATVGTGGGPNIARQTITNFFNITGTGFGPTVGSPPATVRFISLGGLRFSGGSNQIADVPVNILSTTTVQGNTPLAIGPTPFTANVQVFFEDGTCTNLFGPITFNPAPVITSFVNTRPPFQQATPGTFNVVRCLGCLSTPVQVNGANFVAGAVADLFDTAVGTTKPIGTGLLSTPVVTAAQITGGSPIDLTLPAGLTQVTVRVTNPDGQSGTNTTPRWSTDDILANVNASNLAGNNAEMMMAVNPTNNRNAVFCSHDLRTLSATFSPQVLVGNTTDGGATWTTRTIGSAATATVADGFPLGFRGDPMCAADAFGNFYIGYLFFDAPNSGGAGLQNHRIIIMRSSDGGVTWTAPTAIRSITAPNGANGLDRCGMACGPCRGGAATDQAVYVCWHDFQAAALSEIQVGGYRSTGLGAPAAPVAFASVSCQSAAPSPGDDFHHPAVAVGPHGELYVAWIERNSNIASTTDWINRDIDGLGSATFGFGVQNAVTTVVRPNTRVVGWPAPQANRGYASEPWLTVIPTGPLAGRIVFAYDDKFIDDGVPGDQVNFGLRVLTRVSDNLGVTFSSPIQTHVLDVRHQFQPNLGVDSATGSVHCTWYDSGADVANNRAVIQFSAVSSDGVSWVNPMRLMQNSSDIAAGSDGNDYLEYCGVAAGGGCVYACWCDFTPGNGDVFASVYQQHP